MQSFAMGDCDMFLLLLLFAWIVKTTDNPHVMLCVWPLELGIWTRVLCCMKKSSLSRCNACHLHYCGDCLSTHTCGLELVAHAE